jgi:hypothetical protein
MVRILKKLDYQKFAARKSSKEKFLMDLQLGFDNLDDEMEETLDVNKGKQLKNPTMVDLFNQKELNNEPAEVLIAADELAVFIGHNNGEFIDLLTDLWDHDDIYRTRIKNGKSVRIPYPTLNILGGSTTTNINTAFPKEAIGQGFFSRVILIHAEPTGTKISKPPKPPEEETAEICEYLRQLRNKVRGELTYTPEADAALDEIYQKERALEDIRFRAYFSRRYTHLLKLCMICAAARHKMVIEIEDVIYANTILHYTEYGMPKALGEFGKARNSDISARLLDMIEKTERPLNVFKDIWPELRRDLDSQKQLVELLAGLKNAGKIQQLSSGINSGSIIPVANIASWNFPYCNIRLMREWVEQRTKDGLPI